MCCKGRMVLGIALALALLVVSGVTARILFAAEPKSENSSVKNHEWQLPDESLKLSFKEEQPIVFVNRGQNASEWESLKSYWNPMTEKAIDPKTGVEVTRTVVKIKVPLGLNANPPVPTENPMSVAKWKLGKELYFDTALSSDGSVSCASCHAPDKGYTDQSRVSVGIGGNVGGVSSPTVFNSAYGPLQFWDGRAASLEEQSQGPPQNPVEMFDGKGNAWQKVVERLRAKPDTVKLFAQVFGTLPNRDGVAKAIAAYERTVLTGNSIHDRAELSMRKRVEAEETGKLELQAKDYATVLKEAFAAKDNNAVEALGLSLDKDATKIEDTAKKLVNGRNLFFGKARCSACHIGDNFTDNSFHNLGVGAKDLKIPESSAGRYGALPTGHKNPESYGAFKTPTLRKLLSTAPYMHDGSEKTLEETVEFYDRGGNANEFLDIKMRDEEAERAWYKAKAEGKEYKGPAVQVFNGKAIVPLKLNLTAEEKANVVLFMKALQGDKLDPIIAEPKTQPK